MLKNILNLNGAQQMSKKEQQSINGGGLNPKNCRCAVYNEYDYCLVWDCDWGPHNQ